MSSPFSRALSRKRFIQLLATFLLFTLFLHSNTISKSGIGIRSSLLPIRSSSAQGSAGQTYEATLVVASQSTDNTTWLRDSFPTWQKAIYIVDDPHAPLTVPVNKGREAMVYLTYIIDHYHTLSPTTIFLHPQQYQWHNDDPDYDSLKPLQRLQLPYIQSQGFANLRCAWILGCPAEVHPLADYGHASNPPKAGEVFKQSFEELFPGSEIQVPETVGAACCAQFAVARETVWTRSREEYVRFRKWIVETEVADELSGRVFEYLWHIIFGKEAVHCPDAESCYCGLYGLCDLICAGEDSCVGRYTLPPYSSLPKGWPEIGWDGESRQSHRS